MHEYRPTLALAICLVLGCGLAAHTNSATIRFELPNGLQVILRPVAAAPHAAVVTLFSIGNDHDPEGASGLAHYIEHVYASAAAGDAAARRFEEIMSAYPNGLNAQTGDDYTVFATVVEASALESEIQDHAARMVELRITDDDLRRELPRIEEELANMFGRVPALAALNHARERVHSTPHGGRRGGRVEHLEKLTRKTLDERWQRYYKPRNALLVVAGGFDTAQVRGAIEAAFGPLPSGEAIPPPAAKTTTAERSSTTIDVETLRPGMASSAALLFPVPAQTSDDYPALAVLVHRLMMNSPMAAGHGSQEASARYMFIDDPSVLQVVADLKPDETTDEVETRLREFLDRAVQSPWQAHEPALVNQNLAFFLGTTELPDAALAMSVYGTAFGIGRREQLGIDGAALAKELDRVTAEDLRRVAERYFSADQGALVVVCAEE